MRNKKISIILLIVVFIFSPFSFSNIFVFSQAPDVENITGYQEWNQNRIVDKNVVIWPGATLAIGKGIEITFTSQWIGMRVEGNLFIKGTVKEPAIIKGLNLGNGSFAIETQAGSNTNIRNAEIISGGSQAYIIGKTNTAMAASYRGAIQIDGGNVDVQNTTFKNNLLAVAVSANDANVRVNRSRFINNKFDVESEYNSDFRYNWWGVSDGPEENCYDYGSQPYCYYDKIYGSFDFSSWLTQENFHDPVIIIPGILGSWEKNGAMQVDPIFHTYDNLYAEFANNGYTPEQNLFTFPYEWRDSNTASAQKLKTKIDEIKQANNWPKVDIVAHSMGGLLAREYIESGYYGDDVDQLITLAAPNLGAPEAYVKWDGAEWFFSLVDIYMKHIIKQEAEEKGFADIFDYIHNRPVDSLKELLPVYDYLYDAKSSYNLRNYPDNYPQNVFLENLNNNSRKLNLVEYDKIIGNISGNNTIGGINTVNTDMGKYWIHGYPLGFEIPIGDRGMRLVSGDRTVPYISAKSEDIKSDYAIELSYDHRTIVTKAQKDILELLTDKRPITEVNNSLIKNILIAQVYSPVDMQIIAPNGKWAGKNIKNLDEAEMIDGAYYTGHDTDSEFLTIPNPEDGEYMIIAQGTDNGTYRIEISKLTEDPIDGKVAEITGTISGMATTGAKEEKNITVENNKITTETKDTTAPEITITSPENKTYLNNQIISVTHAVSDDASETKNIKTAMFFDDATVSLPQIDLALQKLGEHSLKIVAVDEAGNQSEKEIKFMMVTNVGAISQNIAHFRKTGLITSQKTTDALQIRIKLISGTLGLIARMDKKDKPQTKKALDRLLKKQIGDTIKLIQGKFASTIQPPAGELLAESLNFIKK